MFLSIKELRSRQSIQKLILTKLLCSIFALIIVFTYSYGTLVVRFLPKVIQIIILGLSLSGVIIYFVHQYVKHMRQTLSELCDIMVAYTEEQERMLELEQKQAEILSRIPEFGSVLNRVVTYVREFKRMKIDLETANMRLIEVMEGNADGFFAVNQDWIFTFVNQETSKIMGIDNLNIIGKCIWEVMPQMVGSLTYGKLQGSMALREAVHWDSEGPLSSNKFYEFHAYPFDDGLAVFFRDITELKRQHFEYARLEKLNLIGQLAAGLSHEIRNPLTTVKGFLQIFNAKDRYLQDRENLELLISEIDRANAIIVDFLSLAKPDSGNLKKQDLNKVVRQIFPLLQADAINSRKEIAIELNALPEIMLNEGSIKQLILNLVRNGLEVTPENGKVTIHTYSQGDRIILAVEDQGTGIPQDIQDKIGTPFFTTKDNGTGLGLSISMDIAQKHRAIFDFHSRDNGTMFYVKFPTDQVVNTAECVSDATTYDSCDGE